MTKTKRFLLSDVGHVDHVRYLAHNLQQVCLLALFQHLFEFVTHVEVVFYSLFTAAGNNDDLVAARSQCLLHSILNDGFVYDRQHLFGLGLGRGKKTSAQSGGRKDGFANFHGHAGSFSSSAMNAVESCPVRQKLGYATGAEPKVFLADNKDNRILSGLTTRTEKKLKNEP